MDWTHITFASVITFIVTWLARPYLGSYLTKKGENRAVQEDLDKINRQLEEIKSEFIGPNAYALEKARGLATKEDIGEITRKVEDVKSDVSLKLELIKWELSKKATIHRLAAEKEFSALAEIGTALYELQLATRNLRPTFQEIDPNEPEKERHARRYGEWAKTHDVFMDIVERHKLFMPQALYLQFFNIRRLSYSEASGFRAALQIGEGQLSCDAYLQGGKNVEKMDNAINEAIMSIRQRYGIED